MVGAKLVKIDKFCPLTHVALNSSPLQPSFFVYIIISFRLAWLARVLLSFKRTQSSGNDDVDEGQKTPLDAAIRHSEQTVWSPQSYYLGNLSLFVSSSFPSDPPGWLVHC